MKKFILMTLLVFASFVYAQEKEINNQKSTTSTDKFDKIPEFPGGINEFRKKFMKGFKSDKIKEKGLVKTLVTFVIEKDGSIIEVKALGGSQSFNDESIRAIKKIKEKWIPAELKGEKVKYSFRMPLTMSFD